MWRLPREKVDRIVDWSPPAVYRDLKRGNPSLLPSPEEEEDEPTALLYRRLAGFQARVRREHASKGFVEVDYDCARGEAFGAIVAHLSSGVLVDAGTFRQLRRKMMDGF
ncbi:hypothetical protein VPH35_048793 [Triticum aestivum]